MWAKADESSENLVELYRQAWAHSDESLEVLPLDAPAHVTWWPAERADTTFGSLVVRVLAETAHHAGHCDIVRELIDGHSGGDNDEIGDAEFWASYVAKIQKAANSFR